MGATRAEIIFGRCDESLYVRVDGEAGMVACSTVDQLVSEYIAAHQDSAKIVLDLRSTEWLDSTFTGWMIQLHRQLKKVDGGSFAVCGLSDACRESLATMGVIRLFAECERCEPQSASRLICDNKSRPERERATLMAQAHEELAALSAENERVFGPIAATLRRALGEAESGPS